MSRRRRIAVLFLIAVAGWCIGVAIGSLLEHLGAAA